MTTTNALHYAFQASGDDHTRRLLMLQNAAFLPLFRAAMEGAASCARRGSISSSRSRQRAAGPSAIEEIFADASRDRMTAARKALGLLASRPRSDALDRRRAATGVLEGRRPARLQVQLGRAGRLLSRLAPVARPLPGIEPACSCPAQPTRTTTWSSERGRLCRRDDGAGIPSPLVPSARRRRYPPNRPGGCWQAARRPL